MAANSAKGWFVQEGGGVLQYGPTDHRQPHHSSRDLLLRPLLGGVEVAQPIGLPTAHSETPSRKERMAKELTDVRLGVFHNGSSTAIMSATTTSVFWSGRCSVG